MTVCACAGTMALECRHKTDSLVVGHVLLTLIVDVSQGSLPADSRHLRSKSALRCRPEGAH